MLARALGAAVAGGARALSIDSAPNAEAFHLKCGAVRVGSVAAPIEGDSARVRALLLLMRGVLNGKEGAAHCQYAQKDSEATVECQLSKVQHG